MTDVADALRAHFDTGATATRRWRVTQLRALRDLLRRHQHRIEAALAADLGKPAAEVVITEIGPVIGEIDHALRRLRRWMRPRRVRLPYQYLPARARVLRQPLGVVAIIGPWNYPVHLVLNPLVGALAAGNAVIIKPSELAPATSALLAELLPLHLDPRAVAVVEGGPEAVTDLLRQRLDHIFFTGSERVGRIVAEAAATTLTPVTLELGGKSPVYVDGSVDLTAAARRIMWGKLLNSGQTCVAPDYLLATPEVAGRLVPHLARAAEEFYGTEPAANPDYGRIVTPGHAARPSGLLDGHVAAFGGAADVPARHVAPTIIDGADPDSPLMCEEIFGPVLPIVHVASAQAAIDFITARPKPLALYVFSRRRRVRRAFIRGTTSGGLCFDLPTAHLAAPELPFGGVGASGMGAYHGETSFETFSHSRSVLDKPLRPDTVRLLYPPYRGRRAALSVRLMHGRSVGPAAP